MEPRGKTYPEKLPRVSFSELEASQRPSKRKRERTAERGPRLVARLAWLGSGRELEALDVGMSRLQA